MFESCAVAAAAIALVLYHLQLCHRIRVAPGETMIGQGSMLRWRWVESVVNERRDILAVQTLRNWTMAASLMASTSVLLIAGVGTFLLTAEKLPTLAIRLNYLGDLGEHLLVIKLMVLLALLIFAFMNFTLAMRYFNHVSFDINVPASEVDIVSLATRLLGRAALHYTLGMRGFYLCIPAATWLFGPIWLLIGTVGLMVGLWRIDRLT